MMSQILLAFVRSSACASDRMIATPVPATNYTPRLGFGQN